MSAAVECRYCGSEELALLCALLAASPPANRDALSKELCRRCTRSHGRVGKGFSPLGPALFEEGAVIVSAFDDGVHDTGYPGGHGNERLLSEVGVCVSPWRLNRPRSSTRSMKRLARRHGCEYRRNVGGNRVLDMLDRARLLNLAERRVDDQSCFQGTIRDSRMVMASLSSPRECLTATRAPARGVRRRRG